MKRARSVYLTAVLAVLASVAMIDSRPVRPGNDSDASPRNPAAVGQRLQFSLVGQHGRPVSAGDFRGRWLLVVFGFTQCPDVCPATLALLSGALHELGSDAKELQAIFITIDPEHDTPKALASYLENFGSRFIGLTGTSAQIAAAVDSFGAYSAYAAPSSDATNGFAHSSTVYLLDPQGRLNRQFSSQVTAAKLAVHLRKALRSAQPSDCQPNEGS